MHKINFNEKIDGKRQAAFVIFYSLDGKPWSNYHEKINRIDLVIPTFLMINRADGRIGFVGGKVDEGETLEQAVKREILEEIGFNLNTTLEPVVAHDIGPVTTHAFSTELSYEQLKKIQRESHTALHHGSEVTGIFLPHLIDYDNKFGKGGGIAELIKNSLAPSVREEIIHFFLNKKIFSKKELTEICNKCGYSLETLLQ